MLLKTRNPATMFRIGLTSLVVALLFQYFVHRTTRFSEGFADGASGVLFGIAIGCLIVALRLKSRFAGGNRPPA